MYSFTSNIHTHDTYLQTKTKFMIDYSLTVNKFVSFIIICFELVYFSSNREKDKEGMRGEKKNDKNSLINHLIDKKYFNKQT